VAAVVALSTGVLATPILNYPEVGILGVHAIRKAPNLEHHLENNTSPPAKDAPAKPTTGKPAPVKPKGGSPKDEPDESSELPGRELASKKDYQLNQALNLLKGMQIMQSKR